MKLEGPGSSPGQEKICDGTRQCWPGHQWVNGRMGHCCELADIFLKNILRKHDMCSSGSNGYDRN